MAEQNEVQSLLIPMQQYDLLLPNVAVAEVMDHFEVDSIQSADFPWCVGFVEWRGLRLPIVSIEALHNEGDFKVDPSSRITILNTVTQSMDVPFIAILCQGIPRLKRVIPEHLLPTEHDYFGLVVRAFVQFEGKDVIIPDLDQLETLVQEAKLDSLESLLAEMTPESGDAQAELSTDSDELDETINADELALVSSDDEDLAELSMGSTELDETINADELALVSDDEEFAELSMDSDELDETINADELALVSSDDQDLAELSMDSDELDETINADELALVSDDEELAELSTDSAELDETINADELALVSSDDEDLAELSTDSAELDETINADELALVSSDDEDLAELSMDSAELDEIINADELALVSDDEDFAELSTDSDELELIDLTENLPSEPELSIWDDESPSTLPTMDVSEEAFELDLVAESDKVTESTLTLLDLEASADTKPALPLELEEIDFDAEPEISKDPSVLELIDFEQEDDKKSDLDKT